MNKYFLISFITILFSTYQAHGMNLTSSGPTSSMPPASPKKNSDDPELVAFFGGKRKIQALAEKCDCTEHRQKYEDVDTAEKISELFSERSAQAHNQYKNELITIEQLLQVNADKEKAYEAYKQAQVKPVCCQERPNKRRRIKQNVCKNLTTVFKNM